MKRIEKNISIEELIRIFPESVNFLLQKGIKCLACGEPIWGTLETAAKEKGFTNHEINQFIEDLNSLKIKFVKELY